MNRLMSFILSVFRVRREIDVLSSKISFLQKKKRESDNEISKQMEHLASLEKKIISELVKSKASLLDAQILNSKLEEALDSTRERLKTTEQITIPGLVAAHQVFIQRWEAESKIHSMRAAGAEYLANQRQE